MLAADLVRRQVAVIATSGLVSAIAAKAATTTIPIVFAAGGDPIAIGLVTSLNRPGGKQLGGTLMAKQFEMLHETVPKTPLIGYLSDLTNPSSEADIKIALAAADQVGQKMALVQAHPDSELEAAFITLVQQRVGALIVNPDPFFLTRRDKLAELAARQKIPTIYNLREYVVAGGLMSYGTNITEANRIAGLYAGRILKGEKPSDLPVQRSTKVELVINLKTAKALGLAVPPLILARADEVIE